VPDLLCVQIELVEARLRLFSSQWSSKEGNGLSARQRPDLRFRVKVPDDARECLEPAIGWGKAVELSLPLRIDALDDEGAIGERLGSTGVFEEQAFFASERRNAVNAARRIEVPIVVNP
jgi:hypothetical protein